MCASYLITAGCSNGSATRPQAMHEPEAYPLGYVEDSCETRTQLMDRFSIRLKEPLASEEKRPRHAGVRHPQTDIPLSPIDEVLLIEQIHYIESD